MHRLVLSTITTLFAVAACDGPATHQAAAASASAPAINSAANGLLPGTPPGDLDSWVREIRDGIAALPDQARSDAAAAQRAALDLYVTRQEYAEMYYGVDGRIRGSQELSAAIETAEQRFHELLRLLTTPDVSSDAVRSAVGALDRQQSVVADLWQQSGLQLPRAGK